MNAKIQKNELLAKATNEKEKKQIIADAEGKQKALKASLTAEKETALNEAKMIRALAEKLQLDAKRKEAEEKIKLEKEIEDEKARKDEEERKKNKGRATIYLEEEEA